MLQVDSANKKSVLPFFPTAGILDQRMVTDMYCHNCGAQIPDGAKFCTECGERTVGRTTSEPRYVPTGGALVITRTSRTWNSTVPVEIWIDGVCNHVVQDGETVTINLSAGEYTVTLKQQGIDIISRLVDIVDGGMEPIVFEAVQTHAQPKAISRSVPARTNPQPAERFGNYGGRTCPRCGGPMTTQIVSESRKSGCGTILLYVLLALTIFGLLIVIPLALRKKTETVTYAVCQRCGYQRTISRR